MEVFIFIHFFNDYYTSVGWCDYHFFRVTLKQAYWATEEINHQSIDNEACNSYYIEWYLTLNSPIQSGIYKE